VNGKLFHDLSDEVYRDKKIRKKLIAQLIKFLKTSSLKNLGEKNFYKAENDQNTDNKESLRNLIELLNSELIDTKENISEQAIKFCEKIQSILNSPLKYHNKLAQKSTQELSESFIHFLEIEQQEHPQDKFLEFCENNRPIFIMFTNEDRYLQSSYTIKELENPTPSISNLISISGIKISELLNAIMIKDEGERLKLTDIANGNLKKEYCSSWSQSEVFPRLLLDPDSIKIQVISSGTYTEITSRSDGLKQYIALRAFLALKRHEISPTLLIDEAEIHLHYAAQADLIKEFEKQNLVNSIMYTTHSAGCLPSDLGTGIRAVEPIILDDMDSGLSRLKNSIWQNEGGFSPILFAMGANIIAFTMARKAVIAEGPSETILLPRLFRESDNISYLDFQVAPGIATVSRENASLFEFEAAKEVYLLDGDSAGNANKKKLILGGIDPDKIIQLENEYSIEDYVDPDILLNAVNREFEKSGITVAFPENALLKSNRIGWIEKQCIKNGYQLPSKVRIAENITRNPSDQQIIDQNMKKFLLNTYKIIQRKLEK